MKIWPFTDKTKPAWQQAEDLAARHLRRQGYVIMHRNLRLDRFEVDIIAQRDDTVVFVEVRSRTSDEVSSPEETVRHAKRQHLRAAARRYLARYGSDDVYYRFDVIGVVMTPGARPRIAHYEHAFTMDE